MKTQHINMMINARYPPIIHMTAEMKRLNTIYSMQTDGGLANKLKKLLRKVVFCILV